MHTFIFSSFFVFFIFFLVAVNEALHFAFTRRLQPSYLKYCALCCEFCCLFAKAAMSSRFTAATAYTLAVSHLFFFFSIAIFCQLIFAIFNSSIVPPSTPLQLHPSPSSPIFSVVSLTVF